MMNGINDGMGAGGWLLMSVFWVVLIAVIVWVVAALSTRNGIKDAAASGLAERPDATLDRRLASGEIDPATYDTLRAKLHEARSARM